MSNRESVVGVAPTWRPIHRVGIVGGGIMGSGIAEVCARADLDTIVVDLDRASAATARARLESSLQRAVSKGKLDAADADRARGRVRFSDDLGALADREIVIEAVVEDKQAKVDVFSTLATVLEDDGAILATNTSSIPIVELAVAVRAR